MAFVRIITLAGCLLAGTAAAATSATDVQLVVRTDTGEVELYNSTAGVFDIAGYTIDSLSESLQPIEWMPVAGRLDASITGDSSFDSVAPWIVFSLPTDDSELSEGAPFGPGGQLTAGEFVSLGFAWDTEGSQDLIADVLVDNISTVVDVIFTPPGDYDLNGAVNIDDYAVFSQTFGSSSDLRADGNDSGTIDAADYTIWRDALTTAVAPLPTAGVFILAIPEPGSLTLLVCLAGIAVASGRWNR
ncbi:MAG: hypothetical protein AAGF31_12240 [Planctomycetota bacterium]